MKIERIELHHIANELVHPFRTSTGVSNKQDCILIAVFSEGLVGWGECVAGMGPWYTPETLGTAWHILDAYLIGTIIGRNIDNPADAVEQMRTIRGHPMAKAGLENAIWDVYAKAQGVPVSALWPATRERVAVGVSIGIQPSLDALVERVGRFVDLGYQRVKCKIAPGWTIEPLSRIRSEFPDLAIMADANSAFTLDDAALLKQLDALDLLMIEQPLAWDDIANHARLQAQLNTPICLDESINGVAAAQTMIDLKAGQLINMKVSRVGGLSAALTIHEMAQQAGIAMWCGGMLETGVGRALNVHLATLENFTLPGDISATDRYFREDIAEPPFVLNREDSTMSVPTAPGIGVEVQLERVEKRRLRFHAY